MILLSCVVLKEHRSNERSQQSRVKATRNIHSLQLIITSHDITSYQYDTMIRSDIAAVTQTRAASALTTETVQSLSLPLECVDDIHRCHCLASRMLSVGDGITNDVLEEDLEDTTRLFIDQTRDSLHTTTTSQTTDGRLSDALNVITQLTHS